MQCSKVFDLFLIFVTGHLLIIQLNKMQHYIILCTYLPICKTWLMFFLSV